MQASNGYEDAVVLLIEHVSTSMRSLICLVMAQTYMRGFDRETTLDLARAPKNGVAAELISSAMQGRQSLSWRVPGKHEVASH